MAKYIIHRVNKITQIKSGLSEYGIESDVNNFNNKLVMQHDLNKNGDKFYDFIKNINKNKIIFLNIKSSGIIKKVLKSTKNKNIFFLDLAFSEIDFLIRMKLAHKVILRYSVYERLNLDLTYFKKIIWIWFDFFQNKKIDYKTYRYIKQRGKKICIVSPELLGKKLADVNKFIQYLNIKKIKVDAICTKEKYLKSWKEKYNY